MTDSRFVKDLLLCQVRLHYNAAFPWILLIPRVEKIYEVIDLTYQDQQRLMEEIVVVSCAMKAIFSPFKLNIASLGNIVPQLHIHIIARYEQDQAWPHPVWASGIQSSYHPEEMENRVMKIDQYLS